MFEMKNPVPYQYRKKEQEVKNVATVGGLPTSYSKDAVTVKPLLSLNGRQVSVISSPGQMPFGGSPIVTVCGHTEPDVGDRLVLFKSKNERQDHVTLGYAKLSFCPIWHSLYRDEQASLTRDLISSLARLGVEVAGVFAGFADVVEVEVASLNFVGVGFEYDGKIYHLFNRR